MSPTREKFMRVMNKMVDDLPHLIINAANETTDNADSEDAADQASLVHTNTAPTPREQQERARKSAISR